jgi:hypothetical protein
MNLTLFVLISFLFCVVLSGSSSSTGALKTLRRKGPQPTSTCLPQKPKQKTIVKKLKKKKKPLGSMLKSRNQTTKSTSKIKDTQTSKDPALDVNSQINSLFELLGASKNPDEPTRMSVPNKLVKKKTLKQSSSIIKPSPTPLLDLEKLLSGLVQPPSQQPTKPIKKKKKIIRDDTSNGSGNSKFF